MSYFPSTKCNVAISMLLLFTQALPDVFGHGIVPQVVEFAREEDLPRIVQHVESHGVMFLA